MTPTSPNPHPAIAGKANAGHPTVDVLRMITGGYWINDQHVLCGPRALWEPINPEAGSQAGIWPWNAILHSNAGPRRTWWQSLFRYMRRIDITGEAHFQVAGVRATVKTDPDADDLDQTDDAWIVQGIPLNVRADCNAKANRWRRWTGTYAGAISFETEDDGAGTLPVTPWSVWQIELIVAALTCICVCYGMACTAPTRWDDTGIGYHSQYPEWSIYVGKTCPGAARIRQMDYIRQRVANNLAAFGQHQSDWKCGKGRAA